MPQPVCGQWKVARARGGGGGIPMCCMHLRGEISDITGNAAGPEASLERCHAQCISSRVVGDVLT